jgi:protein-S-isoprenylcysteine O-methyltransferase
MVICGQVLRSAAMITAANNFNHLVQYKKADSHRLVTVGVYS